MTYNGLEWNKVFNNSNIHHNFIRCLEIYNNKLFASTGKYGAPWKLIESNDGEIFHEHDYRIDHLYNDCPIIINGGCGSPENMINAFEIGSDACGAGSIFYYTKYGYKDIKDTLREKKINVR